MTGPASKKFENFTIDGAISVETFNSANITKAEQINRADCIKIDKEVAAALQSNRYESLPEELQNLVTDAPKLEVFDSKVNPQVREAFQNLAESGLHLFVSECVVNNRNILVSVAQFAASVSAHHSDKFKPITLEQLNAIRDEDPTMHAFLNHMAIIAAKEIGYISESEAAVLGAERDLAKQDALITTLNQFLVRGHNKINRVLKKLEIAGGAADEIVPPGKDAEMLMRELLAGNSVIQFNRNLKHLTAREGSVELKLSLTFDKDILDWGDNA